MSSNASTAFAIAALWQTPFFCASRLTFLSSAACRIASARLRSQTSKVFAAGASSRSVRSLGLDEGAYDHDQRRPRRRISARGDL